MGAGAKSGAGGSHGGAAVRVNGDLHEALRAWLRVFRKDRRGAELAAELESHAGLLAFPMMAGTGGDARE